MSTYKVVETFTSIQGEGSLVGQNMFFIRMHGCDLKCKFCDEPKHKDASLIVEYTAAQLAYKAKKADTKWVCITGGEPSLQNLNPLIYHINGTGFRFQVETNGHVIT